MTDLLYSEVEDDLRATVRAMVTDRAPLPDVLARVETDEPYDRDLWHALAAELGCAGLAVPTALGGAGASFRETAVVLEELGRGVTPTPYLGSAVLATAALLALHDDHGDDGDDAAGARGDDAGSEPPRALVTTLLADLAAGRTTAALAVPLSTPPGPAPDTVREEGGGLTGTVTSVADALPADVLLVPAGGALYAVDAADAVRTPVTSLDLTRPLCDITLTGAPGRLVGAADAGRRAVTAALTAGAAMLAAEQLGVAERCLEMTLDHVKNRYQFARPIGSYQALKHRLADLWVSITQARGVSRYAAARLADGNGHETSVAVALAQAHCSAVAVHAAEECVQMHGGIGFTWEHPAHLFLKRAKSAALALGTADRHRAALAALVDLPA